MSETVCYILSAKKTQRLQRLFLIGISGKQVFVEISRYWKSHKYTFLCDFIVDEMLINWTRSQCSTAFESKWPDIRAQYIPVYMYSICERLITQKLNTSYGHW